MQTSVSQRPLTARRRPHMRTADYAQAGLSHTHASLSDSHPARSLSGYMPSQNGTGHTGPSTVPAFRTPAGRRHPPAQLAEQASFQEGSHQHQPAAASTSQGLAHLPLSSAVNQDSNNVGRQQSSDSGVLQPHQLRAGQGYGQDLLGRAQAASTSARSVHHEYATQADSRDYGRSRGVTQDYSRPRHTDMALASSGMYVKPPWAIDETYQVILDSFLNVLTTCISWRRHGSDTSS